jgi:hypothetical protein
VCVHCAVLSLSSQVERALLLWVDGEASLFEAVAPYVVSFRKARRADAAPVDDEEQVDPRFLL